MFLIIVLAVGCGRQSPRKNGDDNTAVIAARPAQPQPGGGGGSSPAAFVPVAKRWERRETKLIDGADVEKLMAGGWVVSSGGRRYAHRVKDTIDPKFCVWVVDGKPQSVKFSLKEANKGQLVFVGDEKHVITIMPHHVFSNKLILLIDEKPLDAFGWTLPPAIKKQLDSVAKVTGSIDEERKKITRECPALGIYKVTHDGGRTILWCLNDDTRLDWTAGQGLLGNGIMVAITDQLRWLEITADGRANLNGVESQAHRDRKGTIFASGGTGFAYVSKADNQHFVVHNGKPSKRFDEINILNYGNGGASPPKLIAISDDGQHYAASVKDGKKHYVLHDDARHEITGPFWGLTLSPDGKRWAARKFIGEAVIDGKPMKSEIGLEIPVKDISRACAVFSLDSREYAFADFAVDKVEKATEPGKPKPKVPEYEYHVRPAINRNGTIQRLDWVEHLVFNEETIGRNPNDGGARADNSGSISQEPVFSPNGKHLAYWVKKSSQANLVMTVDGVRLGKEVERFHEKVAPSFSPDSKSLGWVERKDGEWCAVLDGVPQKGYDAIGVGETRVGFTRDGNYTYLASRGGCIYWVEEVRK
jgi:hypothetical protein